VDCANILTHDGCSLRWVVELRYLGIFIARARIIRCSLNYAKRSFFGAVNGLFGKLLNLASETDFRAPRQKATVQKATGQKATRQKATETKGHGTKGHGTKGHRT